MKFLYDKVAILPTRISLQCCLVTFFDVASSGYSGFLLVTIFMSVLAALTLKIM